MIKVISFNIKCGGTGVYSIDTRAPLLKTVLDQYDGDLIGFQEATPLWMEYIEKDYGETYEIFNHYRAADSLESTPILWKKERFECLDKGYFWLSDTPDLETNGWDIRGHYRICMWVKLRDKQDGSMLAFFNTHYGFGEENQVKSGKLILDYIKAFELPAILTADFNMRSTSAGYKKLSEMLVETNAATVKDPRNTFHGYKTAITASLIDFCFFTPDTITPITSKRMDDLVDGMFPSDHYGVYSEIELHAALSVMSFNVRNNGNDPEDRAKKLSSLIRKKYPDVFGLQEVKPNWMEALTKTSKYDYALQYRDEECPEGTPIFWRNDKFDLLEEHHFWLSETPDQPGPGFGGKYPRIVTMVVLQYKNSTRKFCCVNTHLDFTPENQVASAQLIAEKLKPYGDIPVILTGDLNMQIGSDGYKAMLETFKDVRREVAPRDFTPTTNGFGDEMYAPCIIDYVFCNGVKMRPLSYRVVDAYVKDVYLSDHNGLHATFTLE